MSSLEERKKDLAELQLMYKQATREYTKGILSVQIRKLEDEIKQKEASSVSDSAQTTDKKSKIQLCNVKINNYGWDQSEKFVKLYISLKNVHNLSAENIITKFTSKSLQLQVFNLDNKNYILSINNLMQKITSEDSKHKVKTDMIVIMMKKESLGNWQYLTEAEKKSNDTKTPKFDEHEDPGQSLMNLMKQMYDEGDDEMKRTIAKSWVEAREKQARGDYSM